jgi:branched-chain amino acid aminotransferase
LKVSRWRSDVLLIVFPCLYKQILTGHVVAGHVESHYAKSTGKWTQPVFVEDPYLRIHGMAPGLNYGQQCYEGMKAFRTSDNKINIFRPSKNAERMQHSASFISIPEVPTDHFIACCKLAVGMNAAYVPPHETGAAMYIRPLLFGSSAQLGLNAPEEYTFVVYVIPTGVYHGVHPVDALVLEQFDRAAPEGTGSAKIGGNYAPVIRWSDKAHKDGYGITLHLDSKTRSVVDEFSTSAFIGVKKNGDKIKLVASNSKSVIKSVTADSILRIAESFGWETETREASFAPTETPQLLPS